MSRRKLTLGSVAVTLLGWRAGSFRRALLRVGCRAAMLMLALSLGAYLVGILQNRSLSSPVISALSLEIPGPTADAVIPVRVSTNVAEAGVFYVDVDLNHDGRFSGAGELAYAQGHLTKGEGTVRLHGLVNGSYQVRARLDRPTGEDVASTVQTLEVLPPPGDRLPVAFERNEGQTDGAVLFLGRARNQMVRITATETVLVSNGPRTSHVQRFHLVGANPEARPVGRKKLPGTSNYFIGNDPSKWLTNIESYQEVVTPAVYPGIDLVYHSSQGRLEYDFRIAAGVDPSVIALEFPDVRDLSIDEDGALVLHLPDGQVLRESAPVIYQEQRGQREAVKGDWVLKGGKQAGYTIAAYDGGRELVIDPLIFSTYLGGAGDEALFNRSIAVDAAGNTYVTGSTTSANFPASAGAFQAALAGAGNTDAMIVKLNPAGTATVYATYLGGAGPGAAGPTAITEGRTLAVDAAGNAYVAGNTDSTTFPTTAGAFQTTYGGGPRDAIVIKLNPTGTALVYATYLGGNNADKAESIAIDAAGNAYVGGGTGFTTFPTTPGSFQPAPGGAPGTQDGFLTKLNPTGTALVYSSFLGGNALGGFETVRSVFVDAAGNLYATGITNSANFPTTAGAFQTTFGGGATPFDSFAVKVNPAGSALVYSTFLGGTADDFGTDITVDGAGNAYITGFTASSSFPTTAGAHQTTFQGGANDAFITKLNPTGTALVYSTYIGGAGDDSGFGIAIDATGNAYITGSTNSISVQVNPVQATFGGGTSDAYVTQVNPAGSAVMFSTYLGGSAADQASAIAVDASGAIYIAGHTSSPNFPTMIPVQAANAGAQDAFIAKLTAAAPPAGQLLYGVTLNGNQLITINTTTAAGTLVGPLSSNMNAFGIAFRGSKLYAWDDVGGQLRELNPATGATVNSINIGPIPGPGGEGDIAFRSDGVGFLAAQPAAGQLFTFDVTVPSSSLVGPSAFIDGLAFNTAGVLYALSNGGGALFTVNQTTGATTLVGNTGISGFPVNTSGGLAFDASGNLFAVLSAFPPGPSTLYSINPTTGVATVIGNIGFNGVSGITFQPPPPTAGVTVTQSGGSTSVAEGGATDTYTVVLNTAPTANVTITINPGTQVTVAPATLTFTPANWNTAQTVTVTAVDDVTVEGPHTGTISHTSASTDTAYNAVTIAAVTANITDNDGAPPGPQILYGTVGGPGNLLITINPTTGAGTLVGALSTPMDPPGLGFRGSKLYVWDKSLNRIQELNPATAATITTIDIGVVGGTSGGDLTFRSDGVGFLTLLPPASLWSFDVTVPSSNLITGTLTPPQHGLAFNAAGVLYSLRQNNQELYTINTTTGATTLVGSTGLALGLAGGAIAFDSTGTLLAAAGGNLYQMNVTTGVATLIGSIGFPNVTGLSFGPAQTAGVTVTQSGGSTNVAEGGATDTYTVVLNTAPTANVTITLNPGTQVTAAPATLTFTPANWNTAQTVTVAAVDDALVEGAHTGTITHTAASTDAAYNGVAVASVTVNITDNDGSLPPPTPGGGPEGSYKLSPGPFGDEGSFGFGGKSKASSTMLIGPFEQGNGHRVVLNVSHGHQPPALAAEGPGLPIFLAALGLLVAAGAAVLALRLLTSC